MIHNSSSPFIHLISSRLSLTKRSTIDYFLNECAANLLTLSSSKTGFLLIGLKQQLAKI